MSEVPKQKRRKTQPKKKQTKRIFVLPTGSDPIKSTLMYANTLKARKKVPALDQSNKPRNLRGRKLITQHQEMVNHLVDCVVRPEDFDAIPWPTEQIQPIYPIRTKADLEMSAGNYAPDVVTLTNNCPTFGAQNTTCYAMIDSTGPANNYAITSPIALNMNAVTVASVGPQFITPYFQIIQVVSTGYALESTGVITLAQAVPQPWPWKIANRETQNFLIPSGDGTNQMFPVRANLTVNPATQQPGIWLSGCGNYPTDMVITVTFYNSTSGNSMYVSQQLTSARTIAFLNTTNAGTQTSYDNMAISFTASKNAVAEFNFEIGLITGNITPTTYLSNLFYGGTFPHVATHMIGIIDNNFAANSINDCAVTAKSIRFTNVAPQLTAQGDITFNRYPPFCGFGTPGGLSNVNKITSMNSKYMKTKETEGAYSFLLPETLPYKLLGKDNQLSTRGFCLFAITSSAQSQMYFTIATHYIANSFSQVFRMQTSFSDYFVMGAMTKALLQCPIGSGNPNHFKLASEILRKISLYTKGEIANALNELISVAAPRAGNAIKIGRNTLSATASGIADVIDSYN
jgi:hypothetical protein